ncbi:MAG: energy-coupling factor transporter transmembrane protein EcfT [Defluviitaleaceae bacterium]|nr:energy-coupling factor transporter transmembrane protein EcfT [Defluviitaleaceae bacterium]
MSRITIGQYYPADSVIHRLDPRVKLVATIVFVTVLFIANNFYAFGVGAVFIALVVRASKIPPRLMLRGLRPILFILIFAASLNLFFTRGETIIFQLGFLRITLEGLVMAVRMVSRLVLLVIGSSLLTLATSPIQLTDAIEALLKPLKRVKFPSHDIAMMMTIALRFIPTLTDELEKIMKAQKARGADFNEGGLISRAKSLIPVLVPLFVSAFKRADELATAMEARCYRGGDNRTKMKEMRITRADVFAIVGVVGLCLVMGLTVGW